MSKYGIKVRIVRDDVNGVTADNPREIILHNFITPAYAVWKSSRYIFREDLETLLHDSGISIPQCGYVDVGSVSSPKYGVIGGNHILFDAYIGNVRVTNANYVFSTGVMYDPYGTGSTNLAYKSVLSYFIPVYDADDVTVLQWVRSWGVQMDFVQSFVFDDNGQRLVPTTNHIIQSSSTTTGTPTTGYGFIFGAFSGSSSADVPITSTLSSTAQAQANTLYINAVSAITPLTFDTDTSTTGGGDGDYYDDISDDNLPFSDSDLNTLNALSIINTGMLSLYAPTKTQLQQFSQFMWSNLFDIDSLKKIFQDPIETIINFHIMPFQSVKGAAGDIRIGNISSGVNADVVEKQYKIIPCGELTINEKWGSALDYSPNTKCVIYLPFIGNFNLDTDDVIGHTLTLQYIVDFLTGVTTAQIAVDGHVHYQYNNTVSVNMPITGSNFNQIYSALLSVGVATAGGALAGAFAGGGAGYVAGQSGTIGDLVATEAVANAISSTISQQALGGLVGATAANVMSAKMGVERAGGISQSAVLFNTRKPLVYLTRPRQSLPADYNQYHGYPSNITATLSSVTGYTVVSDVNLQGFGSATTTEIRQILENLKAGVIL